MFNKVWLIIIGVKKIYILVFFFAISENKISLKESIKTGQEKIEVSVMKIFYSSPQFDARAKGK